MGKVCDAISALTVAPLLLMRLTSLQRSFVLVRCQQAKRRVRVLAKSARERIVAGVIPVGVKRTSKRSHWKGQQELSLLSRGTADS